MAKGEGRKVEEVYNQLFCLVIFMVTGILIGALFDLFRILRKSFHTADWMTYIQDILFWMLAGGLMLFSIFTFNNGEIRSYVFIGILVGIIIYMLAISRIFVKSSVTVIKFFKKIFSYPIHLIEKIIKVIIINPILFVSKKGKGMMKSTNKKIHNFTKSDKKPSKINKKLKEKEGILPKM